MATTLDKRPPAGPCGCGDGGGAAGAEAGLLPVGPFYAPRYSFGMLLGVDDFETEQAYHRGKMRLHNAWFHGAGVVWGFDVTVPDAPGKGGTPLGEVRVEPGLALDAAGHELHLDARACMSLGAWYKLHEKDADLVVRTTATGVVFDARVVVRFRACLTRQVPAMAEPCAGAATGTTYSRVLETVEILLLPGLAARPPRPYHRLRLLFGVEDPAVPAAEGDDRVKAARDEVLALGADEQPWALLRAFRRFAALDEIDLHPYAPADGPGSRLFPAADDEPVVLADLHGIALDRSGDDWTLRAVRRVDVTVRPSHVATSTIQELLCGPVCSCSASEIPEAPPREEPYKEGPREEEPAAPEVTETTRPAESITDAGGPRIDPALAAWKGARITLAASSPLAPASVTPAAFEVRAYDVEKGWTSVAVKTARAAADGRTVTLQLARAPTGAALRVVARGTGSTPLLGANLVPLAGSTASPPGGAHEGNDFVLMLKGSGQ